MCQSKRRTPKLATRLATPAVTHFKRLKVYTTNKKSTQKFPKKFILMKNGKSK